MKYNKKGQFLIISVMLLLALTIIIYSQETVNTYKSPDQDFLILTSVTQEVCSYVQSLNGTQINNSISSIEANVASYCDDKSLNCMLSITNTTEVPFNGNWSEHNYTHYEYLIEYESNTLNHSSEFMC